MNAVARARLRLLAVSVALALTTIPAIGATPAAAAAAPKAKPDVIAAMDIDKAVNPGDDFFDYANGAWLKKHPIPASEATWGIGQEVQQDLYGRLRTINQQAAAATSAAPGSDEQKIGDFWSVAMDEARADRLGLAPLQAALSQIDQVNDGASALKATFALQPLGVDALFQFGVGQDEKQSDLMAVHLYQGGLGLPERDYYFNQDADVAKARSAYVEHLQRVFKLLGADAAAAARSATQVMAFETALAKGSRKLEQLRDPQKNYNKMSPAALTHDYTPSIAWDQQLKAWHLDAPTVIVGQPEFFAGLQALLKSTPAPVLRDYLRAHLVDAYAPYLSKDVYAAYFDFYSKVLSGQTEPRPRWKRVLRSEQGPIGMILGRIFVKEYFPAATKARYNDLVGAIRKAYGERIDRLDWMSAATKLKAHEKLAAVTQKVGYPDQWKDYASLSIGRESYAANMMSLNRWVFEDNLSKFGKPVDRSEWDMTPQTYNAYYNPSNNEIVLPAAQFSIPGFSDGEVDDAVVYGYAAASTIGHELTHGFDDEGRQFDAKGNLVDWWSKDDAKQFEQRAAVMVKQFNAYEPLPGMHINGQASLGENIADFGGLLIGIDAFKQTEQYKRGEKIDGYTPMQRFFLGYALSWLFEERQAMLRQGLLSDVHAPPKWRVNGPLSNLPEFYQAFGVKPGQKMWRPEAERVHIW